MEIAFPTFVRASDDTVAPQPPLPSMLELVIAAGGKLHMVPQRTAAHRSHWAGEFDEDLSGGGNGGAAADSPPAVREEPPRSGESDPPEREEMVLTTRTGWSPDFATMEAWLRRPGLVSRFAQLHHVHTTLPSSRQPPPLLRLEDLRLPAVLEASLRRQMQRENQASNTRAQRHHAQPVLAAAAGDADDPMRVAKLEQLRALVVGDDPSAVAAAAAIEEVDHPVERMVFLKGLAAFALPSMLLGQHTILCGPTGGWKRAAALLALGCNALSHYVRSEQQEPPQVGSDGERTLKKEAVDEGVPPVRPCGLLLFPSFGTLAASVRWMQSVFGPAAFSFWTLDASDGGLTPLQLRGDGPASHGLGGGYDLEGMEVALPATDGSIGGAVDPSVVRDLMQIVQEPPLLLPEPSGVGATDSEEDVDHREASRPEVPDSERNHRPRSKERHSHHLHDHHYVSKDRHRHRRECSRRRHQSRRRRRSRSRRGGHSSGRRRDGSRDRRHRHRSSRCGRHRRTRSHDTSRPLKQTREESEGPPAKIASVTCASSVAKEDVSLNRTVTVPPPPPPPPVEAPSVLPPANHSSIHGLSIPPNNWLPMYLQQRLPLLVLTHTALQRRLEEVQGAAAALPIDGVRYCLLNEAERLVTPPLRDSFPKSHWIALTNVMDVDCQHLVTADRSGREVVAFVQQTLLPDASPEDGSLALCVQKDDSIWAYVSLTTDVVAVVPPPRDELPLVGGMDDGDVEARRARGRALAAAIETAKVQHVAQLIESHFAASSSATVSGGASSECWQCPRVVLCTVTRREQQAVTAGLSAQLCDKARYREAALLRITTIPEDFGRGHADVLVLTDHQTADPREMRALQSCRAVDLILHFSLPRELTLGGGCSVDELQSFLAHRCRAVLGGQRNRLFHTRWVPAALRRAEDATADSADFSFVSSVVLLTEHNMQGRMGARMAEVVATCARGIPPLTGPPWKEL